MKFLRQVAQRGHCADGHGAVRADNPKREISIIVFCRSCSVVKDQAYLAWKGAAETFNFQAQAFRSIS